MKSNVLIAVIFFALVISGGLEAQKNEADGIAGSGRSNSLPLGAGGLPGSTCSGSGAGCPLDLPDQVQGATATVDVQGCPTVERVVVGLDVQHTWVGDLVMTLTSPDNTSVVIYDRPGVPDSTFGCSGMDIFAVLDDFALTLVEEECAAGTPTIDGTFRPNNDLSAFDGETGDGVWTLSIDDMAQFDTGELQDWSIDPCAPPPPPGRAQITVLKDFNDGNPAEVEVHLDCNNGLIPDQDQNVSEDDPITFVVTEFDQGQLDCEVTETVPDGYQPYYEDGSGVDTVSCEYAGIKTGDSIDSDCLISNGTPGCDFPLCEATICAVDSFCCDNTWDGLCAAQALELCDIPDNLVCFIENRVIPIDFDVRKIWFDEHPEFKNPMTARAKYSCENESPAKFQYQSFGGGQTLWFDGNLDSDDFDAWPHWNGLTTCTIEERVRDSSVESDDSECENVKVLLGQDADPAKGEWECTIYNTRIYEGIPTLSQYGLAVLALLMLGVGLLGFRRMA